MEELNLLDVRNGCPGITPAKASMLYEACVYCLHKSNHNTDVALALMGDTSNNLSVIWEDIFDDQIDRTYKDQQETTEHGAECVSVALALKYTNYTIIDRSCKGPGFDYWLGYNEQPFQNSARLEISGIFAEKGANTLDRRVKEKKEQVSPSDNTGLPAYISVIEFSKPQAHFGIK